jgi:hypothetical protein
MKNLIVLVTVAVAVVCASLLFKLKHEADAASARAAAAESRIETIAAEAEQLESRSRKLRSQLHEARGEALEKLVETDSLKQQLAGAAIAHEGQQKAAAVFRDPEMRQVLHDEAKSGAARNVKALLDAGLAKHLQLDETHSAQLEQLLSAKASIFWEQLMLPMMTGELDEAGVAATGQAAKEALETNQKQLRALLGEDGYAVYEWFDKTQDQRESAKHLSRSFEKSGQELTAEQQNQLLAVMIEERLSFPFQNDFGDPSKMAFDHWHDNFTDAKINAFFAEKKQLDERVVQRAQVVLTAEQAALLKEMLAQQLLRSKFTARSTMAMFGKRK